MEWNSEDLFIKWGTRIYVVSLLIGMPTAYYLLLGELDRFLIQNILVVVVLNLSMLIGAELLELANPPVLCEISFLASSSEYCGTLYRLCKGF